MSEEDLQLLLAAADRREGRYRTAITKAEARILVLEQALEKYGWRFGKRKRTVNENGRVRNSWQTR